MCGIVGYVGAKPAEGVVGWTEETFDRLRTASRSELKLALVLFCFPPNKGNIGTAADLDVFPSIWDLLKRLSGEGYRVEIPATPEELRDKLLGGNSEEYGVAANVAYRMTTTEYLRLCPYVRDVEAPLRNGRAPGVARR